jgi:hypothetical protein
MSSIYFNLFCSRAHPRIRHPALGPPGRPAGQQPPLQRCRPLPRLFVCLRQTDRQTDRQTEIEAEGQTDRDRETDRQTDRKIERLKRKTDRQIDKHIRSSFVSRLFNLGMGGLGLSRRALEILDLNSLISQLR